MRVLILLLVAILVYGLWPKVKSRPPNILIVSACSLRADRVIGEHAEKVAPRISRWSQDAFVFNNALAERPWENFSFDADEIFSKSYLKAKGYVDFAGKRGRFIVPQSSEDENGDWYWGPTDVLNFKEGVANLRESLLAHKDSPFYAFVHLKYMHYPYADSINGADQLLPKASRARLDRYRQSPATFVDRLPLISLLFNDFDFLARTLKLKSIRSTSGIVSSVERSAKWKQQPGFTEDLQLAEDLYDAKMQKFDEFASDILDLFGDEDLRKNTVIVFTGDHGESFMEHGVLGHSVNLYDEMLRYPLIVKFPTGTSVKTIEGQVNHRVVAGLLREVIEGRVTEETFASAAESRAQPAVLSRDCNDVTRAVRYRSEWKLIKNLQTGASELYDLKADPGEQRNVFGANPDQAWVLEEIMLDRQGEFQFTGKRARNGKTCFPTRQASFE